MEDNDDDLDVWDTFSAPRISDYLPPSINADGMSDPESVIARTLFSKGIVIWSGLPTHIIEELGRAGFEIVKKGKSSGRRHLDK